jgi:hypothetical protein
MHDATWPSVFFAYLFFAIMFLLAVFFCVRSIRDGYWGRDGEEIKHRMLKDPD